MQHVYCLLLIGNSMISSAILEKACTAVKSSKVSLTCPSYSCYFVVFEKLTRACYFQIVLEIILSVLPVQITRHGCYM